MESQLLLKLTHPKLSKSPLDQGHHLKKKGDNIGDVEAKASPGVATAEKQNNGIVAQPAASEESQVLASSAAVDMANEMEQPKESTAAPSSAIIKEAFGDNTSEDRNALVVKKKNFEEKRKSRGNHKPTTRVQFTSVLVDRDYWHCCVPMASTQSDTVC